MDFSKYLGEVGLTELWNLMTAYVNDKIFIGTKAEYENAASTIPTGAMIIITDESDVVLPPIVEQPNSTIAVLGIARLGEMILGKD